jgi:accessory gene regulator B
LNRIIIQELDIQDNIKKAKINYGIECLIGFIFKIILFIIMFSIFNVLELALISVLISSILRYSSGGVHCNTYLKCIILSGIFICFTIIISINIILPYEIYILFSLLLIGINIYKSPIDPPQKPIKTNRKRFLCKIISTFLLILILIIPILFNFNNNITNIIIFSCFFQILSLTYYGVLIVNFINNQRILSGGGE